MMPSSDAVLEPVLLRFLDVEPSSICVVHGQRKLNHASRSSQGLASHDEAAENLADIPLAETFP